jgi:hypothetical protein
MPCDATKQTSRRAHVTKWVVVIVVIVVLLALILVVPRLLVDAHYATVRQRQHQPARDRAAAMTRACPLASV